MKTATVSALPNRFPRVAAWIAEGEPVEITKSGKLFARLVPPTPVKTTKLVKPDIMAQLKETRGDRIFSAKEVTDMRRAEWEGEEGCLPSCGRAPCRDGFALGSAGISHLRRQSAQAGRRREIEGDAVIRVTAS